MNKKQEALRRGLRSFIEDTSKELADLEGRPLRSPENPTDTDSVGASDAVVDAAPERTAPDSVPPRDAGPDADRVERARPTAEAGPGPAPPAAPAHTMAWAGVVAIPQPPAASAEAVPAGPEPQPTLTGVPQAPPPREAPAPIAAHEERSEAAPRVEPPPVPVTPPLSHAREHDRGDDAAVLEPPAPRHRDATAAPAGAEKSRGGLGSRRGPKAPVRRRPRPAAEIPADGVSPAQVHARKGVCFAYFLNHECWRVADAYCNTALQVCITRECPIYQLHKDALEHRFARKFKHFW